MQISVVNEWNNIVRACKVKHVDKRMMRGVRIVDELLKIGKTSTYTKYAAK